MTNLVLINQESKKLLENILAKNNYGGRTISGKATIADNFIRGDGKQNENLTNLLSNKDMNWLKNNLKGESAINNPAKFDNPE